MEDASQAPELRGHAFRERNHKKEEFHSISKAAILAAVQGSHQTQSRFSASLKFLYAMPGGRQIVASVSIFSHFHS
jgi:ribosomal protein L20